MSNTDEPKIQKTTDYKIFERLPGNRTVHEALIRQLMESFTEKPQLRVARPLLLNERRQVIDGQHRLEASIRLKIPAYYMIVPGLTVDDTRLLNALQRTWSLMDYAKSFADTGEPEYRYFINLLKEYGLTPSALLKFTVAAGKENSDTTTHKFRTGQFEPDNKLLVKARLEQLKDFHPYLNAWREQSFSVAVLKLLRDKNYDHERMVTKLATSSKTLVHRSGAADYLRDLEVVYNHNVPLGKHVRFL